MNVSEPNAAEQFAEFLSRFPAEIIALVDRCMPKLRRALPGSNQIVYDYAKSVVVSFSMTERGYEAIVAVAIFPDGIRLYFDKSIPDPKDLLKGSGGKVRSVTLQSASELDRGDIHELLKAAIKHSGATFPKTGTNPMIIQSEAKKKKPRNTKKAKATTGKPEPGAKKKGTTKR